MAKQPGTLSAETEKQLQKRAENAAAGGLPALVSAPTESGFAPVAGAEFNSGQIAGEAPAEVSAKPVKKPTAGADWWEAPDGTRYRRDQIFSVGIPTINHAAADFVRLTTINGQIVDVHGLEDVNGAYADLTR